MKIIKLTILLFVTIIFFGSTKAQFNSDLARKSLVRIMVIPSLSDSTKNGFCSGFIWKKASWIVTTLHGLNPNAKFIVIYPGNISRPAKIIKTIKEPDLALLETYNMNGSPLTLTTEVIPITGSVASERDTDLHALGYWSDAPASLKIDLRHADYKPSTLDAILPESHKKQLLDMTFPSIYQDIYGLHGGSLLPGFSGSPVFNKNNMLVAIGNGGINAGALNVSWSIPAVNLEKLEQVTSAEFPKTMVHIPFLFSGEVTVPASHDQPQEIEGKEASKVDDGSVEMLIPSDNYNSFSYDGLTFYQTKTSPYCKILETAWDTTFSQTIKSSQRYFRAKLFKDQYLFDIYQVLGDGSEMNPGFVVTIPKGSNFYNDTALRCIGVDLKGLPGSEDMSLYYIKTKNQGDPHKLVQNFLNEKFGAEVGGISFVPTAKNLDKSGKSVLINPKLGGGWKREEIRANGNQHIIRDSVEFDLIANISMIYNDSTILYSVNIDHQKHYTPDDYNTDEKMLELLASCFRDCINPDDNNVGECDRVNTALKVYISMVLTTVNQLY